MYCQNDLKIIELTFNLETNVAHSRKDERAAETNGFGTEKYDFGMM